MNGSWRITRVAGIDLSIHWTFGLLLAWVLLTSVSGYGWTNGLIQVFFVLTVFGCVVLHELGHALAARVFGISTHGITLLPVGGVAQLERIPREPSQECVVALAGPAVNVLIAALLFPVVSLWSTVGNASGPLSAGLGFLHQLMWVNLVLAGFNLLPAFPMDGGRILRAFLAGRTDYLTATRWAKRIGQGAALLLALAGLWINPMLVLIAAFVIIASETEFRTVRRESRWFAPWVSAAALPGAPHLALEPVWVRCEACGAADPNSEMRRIRYHQRLVDGVVVIRTSAAR
jgi:Zn-dependent protease